MAVIKIWLKAFIPLNVEGALPVPGMAGQTMLSTGVVARCFLTDGRDFSDDLDASARMHSEIEIDLDTLNVVNELHRCYETTEVDCETGEVQCAERASTDHMQWENLEVSTAGISVDLVGSTHNPCMKVIGIAVSPNLDYDGTLTLTVISDRVEVAFEGHIETYPAFEMYASIADGTAHTVFREPVAEGASLLSLAGAPGRAIAHRIKIPL